MFTLCKVWVKRIFQELIELSEGSAYQVMSAPSIAIDDDVFVRGHLISKEGLEEEVKKRLVKWRARASSE